MPIIHYNINILIYFSMYKCHKGLYRRFLFFQLLIIISKGYTLSLKCYRMSLNNFHQMQRMDFFKSSSCYPLVISRRANLQRCSVIRDLSDRTRQDMILTHRYNNKLANSFGGTPGIRVRQSRGSRVIACRPLFILIGQLFILHLFQWLISVNMKPTRL